jgi:hypothetical protein
MGVLMRAALSLNFAGIAVNCKRGEEPEESKISAGEMGKPEGGSSFLGHFPRVLSLVGREKRSG